MTKLLPIILLLFALCSCKSPKAATPVILTNSDSIRSEVIIRERVDTVTVFVDVPAQSAERETFAGRSHLETDFAMSDAWINEDGSLGHNLFNKRQRLAIDTPVKATDSVSTTAKEIIREIPVPTPVEVERDFTAWERFRLRSFGYLVITILLLFVWLFRKPLIRWFRFFVS